jgi:rubrerythrin
MHKAIVPLMEELETIDWYNQRIDACQDDELSAILAHNRDEEKEHAAMVLEWIKRVISHNSLIYNPAFKFASMTKHFLPYSLARSTAESPRCVSR